MNPEHAIVRFTLAGLSLEWNGSTRELRQTEGQDARALLDVIRDVILDASGTHVPAAVAVERAAKRLAQSLSNLRVISELNEDAQEESQG